MLTPFYHDLDGDTAQEPNATQPALVKSTRYQQHHLPWDRVSKPKRTLLAEEKPSIPANNPDLDNLDRASMGDTSRVMNQPPFLISDARGGFAG